MPRPLSRVLALSSPSYCSGPVSQDPVPRLRVVLAPEGAGGAGGGGGHQGWVTALEAECPGGQVPGSTAPSLRAPRVS